MEQKLFISFINQSISYFFFHALNDINDMMNIFKAN